MIVGLERAGALLRQGEVVGMPTETVYGLAACAWNEEAVLKVFRVKARPFFDPLIVHVAKSWMNFDALVAEGLIDAQKISPAAETTYRTLMMRGTPGPLTLVFPRGKKVYDTVTAGSDHVALRCPVHETAQELLDLCGFPVVAPSANRFGRISPTSAGDVVKELGPFGIAGVLDGGPCAIGVESTIVSVLQTGEVHLERPGFFGTKELKSWGLQLSQKSFDEKSLTPGQLPSHYAPRKPCWRFESFAELSRSEIFQDSRAAVLLPISSGNHYGDRVFALSDRFENDLLAAKNLFRLLRTLDESSAFDTIAVVMPDRRHCVSGLWEAIRDRLTRASSLSTCIEKVC